MYIISHKTKYPYLGKKINLRNAASEWIKKNILKLNKNINFSMKNVYFEDSIQKKIIRISQLKCDIFIDDLPLVLELLPEGIDKYLFNPDLSKSLKRNVKLIRSWVEFHKLLKKNA